MKIPAKLNSFLVKNKVKFEAVSHRTVYTALDKAATLKIKPSLIAKTLVLKVGKDATMVVLPANRNLDKGKFKKAARAKSFDFISEKVMKTKFKGFNTGAIPPFGELFKMPCLIDKRLLKEKLVYISSGNYKSSLKISPKIFEKLKSLKADISVAKKIKAPKKRRAKKNPPRRRMRR